MFLLILIKPRKKNQVMVSVILANIHPRKKMRMDLMNSKSLKTRKTSSSQFSANYPSKFSSQSDIQNLLCPKLTCQKSPTSMI
jgi:hypothetical protein